VTRVTEEGDKGSVLSALKWVVRPSMKGWRRPPMTWSRWCKVTPNAVAGTAAVRQSNQACPTSSGQALWHSGISDGADPAFRVTGRRHPSKTSQGWPPVEGGKKTKGPSTRTEVLARDDNSFRSALSRSFVVFAREGLGDRRDAGATVECRVTGETPVLRSSVR
jgi:hypothetical protein